MHNCLHLAKFILFCPNCLSVLRKCYNFTLPPQKKVDGFWGLPPDTGMLPRQNSNTSYAHDFQYFSIFVELSLVGNEFKQISYFQSN